MRCAFNFRFIKTIAICQELVFLFKKPPVRHDLPGLEKDRIILTFLHGNIFAGVKVAIPTLKSV